MDVFAAACISSCLRKIFAAHNASEERCAAMWAAGLDAIPAAALTCIVLCCERLVEDFPQRALPLPPSALLLLSCCWQAARDPFCERHLPWSGHTAFSKSLAPPCRDPAMHAAPTSLPPLCSKHQLSLHAGHGTSSSPS